MKRNVNTKLRSADAQTKRFGLGAGRSPFKPENTVSAIP